MLRVHKQKHLLIIAGIFMLGVVFSFVRYTRSVQAAVPGDIVINELMYNPDGQNEDLEFLELYNTTGSPIDISDWCFIDGIELATANPNPLCFESGTSIGANDYLLLSPNPAQTNTTYGITADVSYAGTNLSNGGETITLVDDGAAVIDTVTYDDVPPWPTTPDGDGPSLELKDPASDNSLAASWGASVGGPTPGAENSWISITTPVISNVNDPNDITDADTVTVTADIAAEDSVNLVYKVNFDAEVTVAMADDGASGDGAASDGTYGASIPAQSAGDLVRFKVEATNGDGTSSKPGVGDTINYYGYTVADPSVTSSAPIIQWFIDDTDYADIINSPDAVSRFPCVIAYGNDVFDNSEVRVKGNNTLYFPKHNYKFYLPSGYTIQPAGADNAVDEFHYNADFANYDVTKVPTLWWAAEQIGVPTPDVVTTQLQRNGEFEGAYNFIDKFESSWREANGFDQGAMYEDYLTEIIYGATDTSAVSTWAAGMQGDPTTTATREFVIDNNDIPNLINTTVFPAVTTHLDQVIDHNILTYQDGTTGRWSVLHWDLDLALTQLRPKTLVSPHDLYTGQHGLRWYATAMYDQPDLRQMYFRRLRTIADQLFSQDQLLNKYNELTTEHADLITADQTKWPQQRQKTRAQNIRTINATKTALLAYLRQDWAIPAAQTNAERESVSFDVVSASADNTEEYIKLTNSSDQAVDLSDWTIEGAIQYTLPKGAVIPGSGTVYFVRDDAGYRASHSTVIILGQLTNDLGTSGSLTLKTNAGATIDTYAY
ncbi:lamin tail domain-containing protein [Candidatus Saccharibacteria bacterium]|nr:lamin tail domain-containing protein [Candidatus Saccharibacteria bacterium]